MTVCSQIDVDVPYEYIIHIHLCSRVKVAVEGYM